MSKLLPVRVRWFSTVSATLVAIAAAATAQPAWGQLYNPGSLPRGGTISDTLSDSDIPSGQGGYFRDYVVQLNEGDQITIDVTSQAFDTIVSLISPDGLTIAENDDGPDGTTNSLLFTRISQPGEYIVRIRSFGDTGSGPFDLKLTRLRPVE